MTLTHQITRNVQIIPVSSAYTAGTTMVTTTILDMSGWEGVAWVASFGALTTAATNFIKAQQGSSSSMGDAADLTATAVYVNDQDDSAVILDLYRPTDRYVRCVVARSATAQAVQSVFAIKYRAANAPITQSTKVYSAEYFVSPAEGAAT